MTNLPYLIHSLHMVMIFVGNALKEILNCPPTLMPQSPLNNMIARAKEQYTRCSPSEINKEKIFKNMLSNKISIYVQMIIMKINSNPIIGKWCKQRHNRQFLILDGNHALCNLRTWVRNVIAGNVVYMTQAEKTGIKI